MTTLLGQTLRRVVGACAFMAMAAGGAQAATVAPSFGDPVYQKVGFLNGFGTSNETFSVDVAGTYKATLTDFELPSPFDFLLFAVTTTTSMQGSVLGSGSFTFEAVPGVTYFANIAGSAGGSQFALGLFGAEVTYVPIPAAAALLGSALLGLLVVARRRGNASGASD